MSLEEQIAVNQFGQSIRSADELLPSFSELTEASKREHLRYLSDLIWQSKPIDSDIEQAITDSLLKPTYTACVVLRTHRLKAGLNQVVDLPKNELEKVYRLLLYLFKQAYQRRFKLEKGVSHKWWYWDLSSDAVVQSVLAIG